MIVRSQGALQSFGESAAAASTYTTHALDQMAASTYAAIYRTQPNVRTVVDFLARNIAQLNVHAFRRVSDLDRVRLADHEIIRWLSNPNIGTTRYRLFESLMQDMGIYFNAYWLKVRKPGAMGLVRIPPEQIVVDGWLLPRGYTWTLPDGRTLALALDQVVHFSGYDPNNPIMGLSPLETLRRVLAEDAAQTQYRESYWTNSARLEGVITRPQTAAKWTPAQKQQFREQWQARYGGQAGQTAVLEDGMTFTPTSYSARDSEFTLARKLTREEVASSYHVPLPMVGILEHATFSNIKEQHKQLYADTLGPWLENIITEVERQLLPDCADSEQVYLEFNIADKLRGSFEEQAASLYALCGRPIMTANEGRSRLNLPRILDDPSADALALPLNTTTSQLALTAADEDAAASAEAERASFDPAASESELAEV
jgi:HK97 family phage portal protein